MVSASTYEAKRDNAEKQYYLKGGEEMIEQTILDYLNDTLTEPCYMEEPEGIDTFVLLEKDRELFIKLCLFGNICNSIIRVTL